MSSKIITKEMLVLEKKGCSTEMNEVLEEWYCPFTQDTEEELYDKTAKFWI